MTAPRETYISHTFPIIHKDTIIVAATHPNIINGSPHKDGWFLSDFYAFNYLLKGSVADQTWLTAANPNRLLEEYGEFLHGSCEPDQTRKVVLNHEILKSEITPVTMIKTDEMIETFLREVENASKRAKRGQCPLLIMVFCHGGNNHTYFLDNGSQKRGVTINRLKGVLEPGVTTTLLTSACYSGGWAITPELNISTAAAAQDDDESLAIPTSRSVGRICGSVFASATISALTAATSPLISMDDTDTNHQGEDAEESIQPSSPNPIQTETYNEFCRSIWDTVTQQGFSRLHGNFTFSCQDDQWEYSWSRRSGIPLVRFKERWDNLPTYRPSPKGQDDSPGVSVKGGFATQMDELCESIAKMKTRSVAKKFYEICAQDWNVGSSVLAGGMIREYITGDANAPTDREVYDLIHFRWEACLFADSWVEQMGLNRPYGEICLQCRILGFKQEKKEVPGWDNRYGLVWRALLDGGATLEPTEHQGPLYPRPHKYVATTITLNYEETRAALRAAHQYCEFVAEIRAFQIQKAAGSPQVQSRGHNWLRSIGRRVKQSIQGA